MSSSIDQSPPPLSSQDFLSLMQLTNIYFKNFVLQDFETEPFSYHYDRKSLLRLKTLHLSSSSVWHQTSKDEEPGKSLIRVQGFSNDCIPCDLINGQQKLLENQ